MALGTRKMSDLPSAIHRSPIAWFSGGEGNRRQFRESDSTSRVSTACSGNRMMTTEYDWRVAVDWRCTSTSNVARAMLSDA
jgi:hypothetical protein